MLRATDRTERAIRESQPVIPSSLVSICKRVINAVTRREVTRGNSETSGEPARMSYRGSVTGDMR